jgi:hypothetical protein
LNPVQICFGKIFKNLDLNPISLILIWKTIHIFICSPNQIRPGLPSNPKTLFARRSIWPSLSQSPFSFSFLPPRPSFHPAQHDLAALLAYWPKQPSQPTSSFRPSRGPVALLLPLTEGQVAVTPSFEDKTRCSSYVCPGSSCHTYVLNVNTENQYLY